MVIRAPSFIDKVNFVIDYWASDCSEDAYVYVETLAPVALKALGSYFIPDIQGVTREIVKARLKRSESHRRTKGKGRAFVPDGEEKRGRIPKLNLDPAEWVGKKFASSIPVDPIQVFDETKFLFKLFGKLNLLTNWVFIAELTAEGIYDWTSLLYKRCHNTGKGSGAGAVDPDPHIRFESSQFLPGYRPGQRGSGSWLPYSHTNHLNGLWETDNSGAFFFAAGTLTGTGLPYVEHQIIFRQFDALGNELPRQVVLTKKTTGIETIDFVAQASSFSDAQGANFYYVNSGGGWGFLTFVSAGHTAHQ